MLLGILEGATGTEGRSFDGIADADAVIGSVLQKILNLSWLIGKAQDDLINAAASHEIDLIEKKRRVRHGNNGLWSIESQRTEACALTAGENESFHERPAPFSILKKFSLGQAVGCTRITA